MAVAILKLGLGSGAGLLKDFLGGQSNVYLITGICAAQDGASGGSLNLIVGVARSVPYIPVRSRMLQFDSLVRMVEGDNYSVRKKYPVYTFSNGVRTRFFTEDA